MIVFCAYRNWALKCCSRFKDKSIIVSNADELYKCINDEAILIEVIIFVGWSDIIDADVIDKYTCLCYHPSDLPLYRGGSPLQNQIIDGVTSTNGTLFKMDHNIDSGPVYQKEPLSLEGDMDQIFINLEINAATLIEKFITDFQFTKNVNFVAQNDLFATKFKRRKPEMSEITIDEIVNCDGLYLYNKIRALGDPYPNAFIRTRDGKRLLIKKAEIV